MKRLMPLMMVLVTAAAAANDWAGPSDTLRVEIPLRNGYISHHETIKINRLMDQRTHVEPSHYRLKAVVLHARADRDGYAQLKIRGDYSPQMHIPHGHGHGDRDELFKVRVPAPNNSGRGTWRLRVSGGVYIGRLVAVLEPRHDHYTTGYRTDPYRDRIPLGNPFGRYYDHEYRGSPNGSQRDTLSLWGLLLNQDNHRRHDRKHEREHRREHREAQHRREHREARREPRHAQQTVEHENRHAKREHDAGKRDKHQANKGDEQVSSLSRGSRTSRQGRASVRAGQLNASG